MRVDFWYFLGIIALGGAPLSGILTHPSMYKVPIRWYILSLICIGWIPGPDFGALVKGQACTHLVFILDN